jgi:hypothetical protein
MTTLYLRNQAATPRSVLPVSYFGPWGGPNKLGVAGSGALALSPTPNIASQTVLALSGIDTTLTRALGQFLSNPFSGSYQIPAGAWSVGFALSNNKTTAYSCDLFVGLVDGTIGTLKGVIVPFTQVGVLGRSGGGVEFTAFSEDLPGNAVLAAGGDSLVVEAGINVAGARTSVTASLYVDGITPIVADLEHTTSAQSFITCPVGLPLS